MKISSISNVKRRSKSMSEKLAVSREFEQNIPHETERKYVPIFPEQLSELREASRPIEHIQLSHPSEPFSLRIRETLGDDGSLRYTAGLKSRGEITDQGLKRMEIEVEVSPELYRYYKTDDVPVGRKLRTTYRQDVTIDYFEDGYIQCENENPSAWQAFIDEYGDSFVEVTGDRSADNEWRTHLQYRREHGGVEALTPSPELDTDHIANEIFMAYTQHSPVIVRISGRSGSGKSTIVREVQQKLRGYGLGSEVVSTDDYHRGASWLTQYNNGEPWMQWDHPAVYDTATMAANIERLVAGEAIPRREIDFSIVEPVYNGEITATPVIIIEGIYARSADFSHLETLDYTVPTPLATCIGRRLLRDMRERPQFANPADSLRYMLEQAEPMWRGQLSQLR